MTATEATPRRSGETAPPTGGRLRPTRAQRTQDVLLGLLPGALVVLFAFQGGGYFPGATAAVTLGFVVLLVVRLTTSDRPVAGLSGAWVAGVALLTLFAIWTLLSSRWSDSPARALIEYDRALLYLLVFVTFGAFARTPERLRILLRGLALGVVVVCVCALTTRLAPDVWRIQDPRTTDRLSYPVGYWNALGLLAALGCSFCAGLTADVREPRTSRVLAAAALPLLGATLVLTLSRGSIVAAALGLIAVVVIARPRLLLSGLIAGAPTVAVAVRAALESDVIATPTNAAVAADGHRLVVTLVLCAGAAALLRAVALPLDMRIDRLRVPALLRRRAVLAPVAGAVLAAAAAAFVLAGGPSAIDRQVDRFKQDDVIVNSQERLNAGGNNGRLDQWRVALDAYGDAPFRGHGAGTSALQWELRRPVTFQVEDGHSLYLEVLGELGIVGLVLVAGAILLILVGLALCARGPDRVPAGALCAAAAAWAVHAGVDWDWEMPVVTLWVFAAGGAALAATPRPPAALVAGVARGRSWPRGSIRILAGLACLFLALTPLSILRSERPLRDAQRAFGRGDCATAIDRALASSTALSSRPEPYLILGYCDIRLGYPELALSAVDKAVARDPANWEYRYGQALVRGAQGLDPRPAARRALTLNPRERLAKRAVKRFATNRPETWKRRALAARLPSD